MDQNDPAEIPGVLGSSSVAGDGDCVMVYLCFSGWNIDLRFCHRSDHGGHVPGGPETTVSGVEGADCGIQADWRYFCGDLLWPEFRNCDNHSCNGASVQLLLSLVVLSRQKCSAQE